MLRAFLGTVVGCVAAFAVIMAVEMAGSTLFPLPTDITPSKTPGYVEDLPLAAKLLVLGGWWLGAAFGGWLANAIGRASWPALVVGVVIAAAVVANVVMMPHPLWMQIAGVLGPLAIGGAMWRSRRRPAA